MEETKPWITTGDEPKAPFHRRLISWIKRGLRQHSASRCPEEDQEGPPENQQANGSCCSCQRMLILLVVVVSLLAMVLLLVLNYMCFIVWHVCEATDYSGFPKMAVP